MKIGNSTDSNNDLSFFPNLPKKKRGIWQIERGNHLLKEIYSPFFSVARNEFSLFYPHGICYRFEVMEFAESPYRLFLLLKSWFGEPPAVIIQDNFCNLDNYCLNRDPLYFANTLFVEDRLYWIIVQHVARDIGPTHFHHWVLSIHRLLNRTIQN